VTRVLLEDMNARAMKQRTVKMVAYLAWEEAMRGAVPSSVSDRHKVRPNFKFQIPLELNWNAMQG